MTLKELEQKRRERGYTYKQVAELSGLPEETVICALGRMDFPGNEAMKRLEHVFRRKNIPDVIKEAVPAYAAGKGPYTLEDYYALPDDRRAELIDGVIYDMTAPSICHQSALGGMFNMIQNYIHKKKGKCRVFMAPVDVQLDCDYKTMVQPDLLIVRDKEKIINRCIMGAPDFVVEILAKSTRKKDMSIKLEKYRHAGVREYWMVDRKNEKVVVYDFENDEMPVVYGFESEIPIGIYQGDLKIDFAMIKEELDSLQ